MLPQYQVKLLALPYPEHLSATCWAHTLSCWSTILHSNGLSILYFPLGTALYTVCLHCIYPPFWLKPKLSSLEMSIAWQFCIQVTVACFVTSLNIERYEVLFSLSSQEICFCPSNRVGKEAAYRWYRQHEYPPSIRAWYRERFIFAVILLWPPHPSEDRLHHGFH